MTTISMTSENNKNSAEPYRQSESITHEKIQTPHAKRINRNYYDHHGETNLSWQMGPVLYQIFKTILSKSSETMTALQYKYTST